MPAAGSQRRVYTISPWRRYVPLDDPARQALLAEQRQIPSEAFAWHLRRGQMRADIVQFAPHLQAALGPQDGAAHRPI